MSVSRAALEKKMAGRQGREDLIKKGLLEMMEQGKWGWAGLGLGTQLGVSWGPSKSLRVECPRGPLSGCGGCTGLRPPWLEKFSESGPMAQPLPLRTPL